MPSPVLERRTQSLLAEKSARGFAQAVLLSDVQCLSTNRSTQNGWPHSAGSFGCCGNTSDVPWLRWSAQVGSVNVSNNRIWSIDAKSPILSSKSPLCRARLRAFPERWNSALAPHRVRQRQKLLL